MTVKIRMDSTQQIRRTRSTWTITQENGETIKLTSEAEWGNTHIQGPNPTLTIDGNNIDAHTIITMAIHGHGPTNPGEEDEFDTQQMQNARENGYLNN